MRPFGIYFTAIIGFFVLLLICCSKDDLQVKALENYDRQVKGFGDRIDTMVKIEIPKVTR